MSTSKYFFSTEKGFGFGKKKEKDEGWSRWFKDDEMKSAYNVKKIRLLDEEYKSAGIPIIIDDKYAWVDDGENHSLIIGASGSGKTWTIIDPLVKILAKDAFNLNGLAAFVNNVSYGSISAAFDVILLFAVIHNLYGHLVLCKSTCLIRADNVNAAQSLYGKKSLYDGVALCHLCHADRKDDRYDCCKTFRDSCNSE